MELENIKKFLSLARWSGVSVTDMKLTDDRARFRPMTWAEGEEETSCSISCFSFSLSVDMVLKADLKVK